MANAPAAGESSAVLIHRAMKPMRARQRILFLRTFPTFLKVPANHQRRAYRQRVLPSGYQLLRLNAHCASIAGRPGETSRFPRDKLANMSEVTRILSAIEQGDPSAAEQLLPLV